jgi:hypothetical protein
MEVSINGDTQKLVVYKENPSINGLLGVPP